MFHELLSRDHEDECACPPSSASGGRTPARHCEASAEADGRGGRARRAGQWVDDCGMGKLEFSAIQLIDHLSSLSVGTFVQLTSQACFM